MSRSGFLTVLAMGSLVLAPAVGVAGAAGRPVMAMGRIAPAALNVAKRVADPFEQRIIVEPPPLGRRIAVEQLYGSGSATGRIEARIRLRDRPIAAREKRYNIRPH